MTDDRSNSRAADTQIQCKNEDGIENDVYHSTDQYRQHADFGEALCVDIAVHACGGHGKQRTQQINLQIVSCVGEGVGACPEGEENGLHEQIADGHNDCGADQEQREGVAENFGCPFMVTGASCDGEGRHAAHAKQGRKCHHQRDDGKAQSHTRQRQRASVTQMADVNAVHDVIQQLHQLGDGQRNSLCDDALPHGTFREVDISIHSRTSLIRVYYSTLEWNCNGENKISRRDSSGVCGAYFVSTIVI